MQTYAKHTTIYKTYNHMQNIQPYRKYANIMQNIQPYTKHTTIFKMKSAPASAEM
jgi:hypothetical protein